jgi:hypothetical protein
MITNKILQPTNDAYIQFTEEELQEIGAGAGTKFSVKHYDDGSIELRPYVKVEIDIEDWSREVLELLIAESVERDLSVNDVITDLLKESLVRYDQHATDEDLEQAKKDLLLEMDYLYNAEIDPNFTNNDTSILNN